MQNKYVPLGANVFDSKNILIDFQYYREDKCEIKKIPQAGKVRKFLNFIKAVGKCIDNDELHEYLKGSNAQDMSDNTYYQKFSPRDDLKVYEVWHGLHVPERIFYTRAGNIFYPLAFLANH